MLITRIFIVALLLAVVAITNIDQISNVVLASKEPISNKSTNLNLSSGNNTSSNFLTYSSPLIQIQYPADWRKLEYLFDDIPVIQFIVQAENASDPFADNINLSIMSLQNKTTFDEYAKNSIRLLNTTFSKLNFTINELKPITLANNSAQEILYSVQEPITGLNLKAMQIFAIKENKVYTITYTAEASKYDTYLPIVEKMVDSFQISPPETVQKASDIEPTTVANQTTDFDTARKQYLSAWNRTEFHPAFHTFVVKDSVKGYGVYKELQQNPILESGKGDLYLYVEPVGFEYKPVLGERGKTVYQTNFTANVLAFDKEGKQIQSLLIPQSMLQPQLGQEKVYFNNKPTEQYILVPFYQELPFPEGEYKIRFFIIDGNSGKSFQIEKNIRIAEILQVG